MAINFKEWREPDIAMHTRNCPSHLIVRYLVVSAQQFCREVPDAWTHRIVTATLGSSATTIDLATDADPPASYPTDGRIFQIDRITRLDDLDQPEPIPWAYRLDEGRASITVERPGRTADETVTVWAAMEPTDEAATFPDVLGPWRTAICNRTLWELLQMAGQDWHNPQLAASRLDQYHREVADARLLRDRHNTRQPPRVARHPFP